MPIDFPASPALNATYTFGNNTWQWNGSAWDNITSLQGTQGTTGSQGTTGAQGTTGTQGTIGLQGTTGSQGTTGTTGSQGTTGATGSQGTTGTTGSQGTTGTQGATGTTGNTGAQGTTGATGSQGTTGATGSQGTTGTTGSQGTAGTAGATGAQGATGTSGATGAQGATGTAGATGAQGATGTAGTNGAQGATGADGAQGVQGVSAGNPWQFSTTTTAGDPGNGFFRFNSSIATSSVTQIYISETDFSAASRTGVLNLLDASTNSANRSTIMFGLWGTSANTLTYTVNGAITDNGTWRTIPVTHVSGGTFPANNDVRWLNFGITGNVGAQGATGTGGAQGATGATGAQGTTGTTGAQGSVGQVDGVPYTFSTTTTDADPGIGVIRYNNAAIGSVNTIFIDNADALSNTQTGWYDTWDDTTTSAVRGTLLIQGTAAASTTVNVWNITGAVTVAAGYYKIPVSNVSGTLPANGAAIAVQFFRTGAQGTQGTTGLQGTTGSGLQGTTGIQGAVGPTVTGDSDQYVLPVLIFS